MIRGAEALFGSGTDLNKRERARRIPPPRIHRAPELPPVDRGMAPDAREKLILHLAADRMRELRDDGVTLAYVARMYGVHPDELEALYAELIPRRR